MARYGRSFPAVPIILAAVLSGGPVTATGAAAEIHDVVSGVGTFVPPPNRTGTGTPAEAHDTASAVGVYTPPPRTATGTVTNANDMAAGVGSIGIITYPASISGRKLLDQHGNVYLARTFSSWSMASHLTNAEITQALTDVAANNFNGVTVWMGGVEDRGTTGWAGNQYKNKAGNNFWTGTPWASSLGSAWTSVDWLIAEALRLGLVVHFSFCGGYDTFGCSSDWVAATTTQMHDAGVAIANRYLSYPNIVWHVMFDYSPGPAGVEGVKINALFDGINDTEGAGTRPVRWMEPNNGSTTLGQGWYDPTGATTDCRFSINCMYEYSGNSAVEMEAAWAEVSGPVGDCEPPYVGSGNYPGNEDQQIRERNYTVFLEGGCLINFGHEDWWPFGAAGLFTDGETWDTVVTDTEVVEASYAWTLIDTYCKDTTWAPTSSFVTTGAGTTDTKAAVGASNTAALAYFPDNRTVVVDTTIITGTANVRLRWYDPTAGTFSSIATSEAQNASRSVTLPAAHGDGTRDFVLVVDSLERTGTGAVTNIGDTATGAGTFTAPARTGTGTPGEAHDSAVGVGDWTAPARTGTGAVVEAHDGMSGVGDWTPSGVPAGTLNDADAVYVGSSTVTAVHVGTIQVWP